MCARASAGARGCTETSRIIFNAPECLRPPPDRVPGREPTSLKLFDERPLPPSLITSLVSSWISCRRCFAALCRLAMALRESPLRLLDSMNDQIPFLLLGGLHFITTPKASNRETMEEKHPRRVLFIICSHRVVSPRFSHGLVDVHVQIDFFNSLQRLGNKSQLNSRVQHQQPCD